MTADRPDPRGVVYVDTDIPAGVTIADWRHRADQPPGRHQTWRKLRLLRPARGSINTTARSSRGKLPD